MATGYVHNMLDKNQTFEQFALECARNFGALIEMRDEPMNAPIPDSFKPSGYSVRRIAECEAELARYDAMTTDERIANGHALLAREREAVIESRDKRTSEIARINAMLAKVEAWDAPSPNHAGLRTFMLEQLTTSLDTHMDGYYERELARVECSSPMERHNQAVHATAKSLDSARKAQEEESARYAERNQWLRTLRESLAVQTF